MRNEDLMNARHRDRVPNHYIHYEASPHSPAVLEPLPAEVLPVGRAVGFLAIIRIVSAEVPHAEEVAKVTLAMDAIGLTMRSTNPRHTALCAKCTVLPSSGVPSPTAVHPFCILVVAMDFIVCIVSSRLAIAVAIPDGASANATDCVAYGWSFALHQPMVSRHRRSAN